MKMFAYIKEQFDQTLQHDHNRLQVAVFCKSLYAFLVLKIIFLWSVLPVSQHYFPFQFRSSLHHVLFAPAKLAQADATLFLISFLLILLLGLILSVNYFTGAWIWWFSFSLTRMANPVVNGSDYVLNVFLFLSIFLSLKPAWKSPVRRDYQLIISNFTWLVCRIQLSLIYLMSGVNKLTSAAWRSGDAVFSITNLDFFIHPELSFSGSQSSYQLLAWIIILFELLFPIVIWFKRFRVYALIAGVIFHLMIMVSLTLPDFGLIMILLYSLFVRFDHRKKPDHESSLR